MPTSSFRDLDTKIRERFKETANATLETYAGLHGGKKMNDDEDLDSVREELEALCIKGKQT